MQRRKTGTNELMRERSTRTATPGQSAALLSCVAYDLLPALLYPLSQNCLRGRLSRLKVNDEFVAGA